MATKVRPDALVLRRQRRARLRAPGPDAGCAFPALERVRDRGRRPLGRVQARAVRRRGADLRRPGDRPSGLRALGLHVAALKIRFCDELDGGFGWVVAEFMERCSHALVVDGRVWVIDPVDGEGVEERIRAAGEPAGVIQLLDRHNRDSKRLAARLGVQVHLVPREPVPPFSFLSLLDRRRWREVALWWPERRVLVCADVLGTAAY